MTIIDTLHANKDQMVVENLIAEFYKTYPGLTNLIDAGANRGFHFEKMTHLPDVQRCLAIEANPEHIDKLKSLVIEGKSQVVDKALVGNNIDDEEVTFKISKEYHGRGGVKGAHIWEIIQSDLKFAEVTVPTVKLDVLVEENFPKKLDFMKMDLEGSELGILLHSHKVYEKGCMIVMENSFHGPALNQISREDWISFVESKGYFIVDFNFEPCVPKNLFHYNHAFLIPKGKYLKAKEFFLECCKKLNLY